MREEIRGPLSFKPKTSALGSFNRGKNDADDDELRSACHYFVKIDFGSMACIPFVPSTTCVTIRSIVALNSM